MDTDWLKTFVQAAHTENFRRAAQSLWINQATVSHHVARLEAELGVELFIPDGRGVRLTNAGKTYLSYAEDILTLVEESQRTAKREHQRPHLQIAASPSLAETVLPWLSRELFRRDPELDLMIAVYPSSHIADAFTETAADVALSRLPAPIAGLESIRLFADSIELVTPADQDAWDVHQLLEQSLLVEPSASYTSHLLSQWRGLGHRPKVLPVSPISVIKRLVEERVGVAFLPQSATVREVLEGRLVSSPWPELPPIADAVYWIRRATPTNTAVKTAERILHSRWPDAFPPWLHKN